MKITKTQLKEIIKETLEEGGFGGLAQNLGASAGREMGTDSPDAFLQRPSTPDTAIQGVAHEFFMKLGIILFKSGISNEYKNFRNLCTFY